MPNNPTLLEMLQSGVHFGHQAKRWHPKMAPYIFGVRSNVHVVDLEKTQQKLAEAAAYVKNIAAKGGTVLFLGTKRQAQAPIKEAAIKCEMPYITERWLGGTLTNFSEIHRLVTKFTSMKKARDTGELEKYTKKERSMFDKEITKLGGYLAGVENMSKLPDAIFIIDIRHEKTARQEAHASHVPIVALCDTNVNPTVVEQVIPGNDDAVRSIALVANVLAEAIIEGRADAKKAGATLATAKAGEAVAHRSSEKVSTAI